MVGSVIDGVKVYLGLFLVFVLSLLFGLGFPKGGVASDIASLPAVCSLLAALYQLMRDNAAYRKEAELQGEGFRFALGATSHMANKVFDKQVEFSEEYINAIFDIIGGLYTKGDTPEALDMASDLYKLRKKYSLWLSSEVVDELSKFESALLKIGASARYIEATEGSPNHELQRRMRIDDNFKSLSELLGLSTGDGVTQEAMVDSVQARIREIVGADELIKLREELVQQALQ